MATMVMATATKHTMAMATRWQATKRAMATAARVLKMVTKRAKASAARALATKMERAKVTDGEGNGNGGKSDGNGHKEGNGKGGKSNGYGDKEGNGNGGKIDGNSNEEGNEEGGQQQGRKEVWRWQLWWWATKWAMARVATGNCYGKELSHQYINPRVIVLPIHVALTTLKQNTTPRILQPTSSFLVFTPHQSPPSYSDLAKRRNLVLQLHTPRSSILRFKIFLRLWSLVKFCPIIMHSTAHNLQIFAPAILTRLMVFERQRMLTLMWVRHHSATSAFVSNLRCFMWAKR
jgi:hypothetical protein